MREVRIFFEKRDTAKYISHLDLMRCFSRAVKRAGIAVWHTEGFNPHPFMTFSLPLSLGVESLCETVDMRIIDEMSNDEIMKRLNDALPAGIHVVKVAPPDKKAEEITFASYIITFYTDFTDKVKNEIERALGSDEILAEKKAKQGRKKVVKQINLKENIKDFSLYENENGVVLSVMLTAGAKNNIKPSLLVGAISGSVSDLIERTGILKEKTLCADMTEFR